MYALPRLFNMVWRRPVKVSAKGTIRDFNHAVADDGDEWLQICGVIIVIRDKALGVSTPSHGNIEIPTK